MCMSWGAETQRRVPLLSVLLHIPPETTASVLYFLGAFQTDHAKQYAQKTPVHFGDIRWLHGPHGGMEVYLCHRSLNMNF